LLVAGRLPLVLLLLLTYLSLALLLPNTKAYLFVEVDVGAGASALAGGVAPAHDVRDHEPLDVVHALDLHFFLAVGLRTLFVSETRLLFLVCQA